MKRRLTIVVLSLLAFAGVRGVARGEDEQDWGDLTGQFVYDGEPPIQRALPVGRCAACAAFNVLDESLVVDKDGGIANVVIYVRTKDIAIHSDYVEDTDPIATVVASNGRFEPHVKTVWLSRQDLLIQNFDQCAKNLIFSPLLDSSFNVLLREGELTTHELSRIQNIPQPLSDAVHPWMRALIVVRDNPYAVVSETDGRFKIAKLPVGMHEFQIYHENRGYLATPEMPGGKVEIEIKPGENVLGDRGIVKLTPEQLTRR